MIEEILKNVRPIDKIFAKFVLDKCEEEEVAVASAIVSYVLSIGDTCVDILSVTEEKLWPDISKELRPTLYKDRKNWIDILKSSSIVGNGTHPTILVLRESKLYLYKYFIYEKTIADRITSSLNYYSYPKLSNNTIDLMKELFKTNDDFSNFEGDLQLAGSILPLLLPFVVISGGPGTGKTTTITKLLTIILSENINSKIAISAPTGKAAQRMNESINNSLTLFSKNEIIPENIINKLSNIKASTIHRLLGSIHLSPNFKHNEENKLDLDYIVIDESSMINLSLLYKLFTALDKKTNIILLGDQYQLASVDAGAVLGSVCKSFNENSFDSAFVKLHSRYSTKNNIIKENKNISPIIQLKKSFRFNDSSAIGKISKLINSKNVDAVINMLHNNATDNTITISENLPKLSELKEIFKKLLSSKSEKDALKNLTNGIILTALNIGEYGQEEINQTLIEHLSNGNKFIENMPILILENKYDLSLFNGDIGIIKKYKKHWYAYFQADSGIKNFPMAILPNWQPAFAITIHKSQGSEYNNIFVVLGDNDSKILTKELIYTAITRAKPRNEKDFIKIIGKTDILRNALDREVNRESGLIDEIKESINTL